MEEHFLKDFVSGPSGVPPEPWYNPHGDCIIYQTTNEAIVADRIDEVLTIYRSFETSKAVGYQIKDVGAIIKLFGWEGICVECRETDHEILQISLYALLLAAYEKGPKTIGRRKAYADVLQSCASHPRLDVDNKALAIGGG